ncbi:hypothetical protein N7517_003882 [Penicillium concentricum]|uniref:Uncharacterized protein n=1 Tax=Penicillium concentricum TaxID=293559 RepID=A0A9W9VA55_9EURO|nr:uncharacterized protein N7517_003882 [Penicillium concentricum]KAJ5371876.1 hypothetical protein N7517_003882 [Penicillium concentricum]
MGFIKSGLVAGGTYSLIKAASKSAAEYEEQKQKEMENIQPAAQRLRHAAQQRYYLENRRRMGYKDSRQRNNPHAQPSYPLDSNHDSNVNQSKPQAQSKSTYQPSTCRTSTKTMENPPPYEPSPQAQSQSTHQPSMSTRAMENPPPYDQSHPSEMRGDSMAGSDAYSKSK